MFIRIILLAAALLASGQACAQTLVASWYGYPFHRRITASGCRYDMNGLSAASRTMPLGTVLALSRHGRSVLVLINDRGPYVRGRDLDLSRGAAARLGMLGVGVAPVQAQVVGFQSTCTLTSRG
jgi:rare lipoprotein A